MLRMVAEGGGRVGYGASSKLLPWSIRTRSALIWFGLVLLVVLGVIAAMARVLAVAGVWPELTELRLAASRSLLPRYAAEIPRIERSFAANSPILTLTHVVAGAVFLTLGLLQFSAAIRKRHLGFHRWSGRALVMLAVFAGLTGLWLGIVTPYSATERLPTAAAGAMFLAAPAFAVAAVRRGDIARHREWMIRFFAVGLGIVVIRLVGAPLAWLLSPARFGDVIGWTFWAGWLISLTVGEVWIRTPARANSELLAATPLPPRAAPAAPPAPPRSGPRRRTAATPRRGCAGR